MLTGLRSATKVNALTNETESPVQSTGHFGTPPRPSQAARGPYSRIIGGLIVVLVLVSSSFWVGRVTAPETATPESVSGDAAALLQEGLALHVEGKTDEAQTLYLQVLALEPDNVYAQFNLGVIEQFEGRLSTAIERYEGALRTDPRYGPALYNVGLAYAETGDTTKAIERLRTALEVTPDSAPVMFNLGRLLVETGNETEGNGLLESAYAIDPSLKTGS